MCDGCLPILLKYLKNALDLSLGRGGLVPDNPAQGIKDKYGIPSPKGLQTAQVMGAVLLRRAGAYSEILLSPPWCIFVIPLKIWELPGVKGESQ